MYLPIYNISLSEANGPGNRLVIWVQGCRFNCRNCFNPETHKFSKDRLISVKDLIYKVNNEEDVCGVTFSGGEPLEYPQEIYAILCGLKTELNSIVFSGYTIEEILMSEERKRVVQKTDLSILGRYNDDLPHPYLGKKFVRSSNRIDMEYFRKLYNIEYSLSGNTVTKTGIFKI